MCSGESSDLPVGDRLVVNAKGIAHSLPLTEEEATEGAWTTGSCIETMGTHYFYDLVSHPKMSWEVLYFLLICSIY